MITMVLWRTGVPYSHMYAVKYPTAPVPPYPQSNDGSLVDCIGNRFPNLITEAFEEIKIHGRVLRTCSQDGV